VAVYRSLVPGAADATLARVEAKPAFTLGHSSPHSRLPAGPFAVVWTGVLVAPEADTVHFAAYLGGEATLKVDHVTVLRGRGESDTTWVRSSEPFACRGGVYRLRLEYRSLAGVPARLQLWWEGQAFAREPLPAWRLKHVARELPEAARQEELVARGRTAVGQMGCARCHQSAFPGVADPPPGPSLADLPGRVERAWLLRWLEDPARVRPRARMPALFTPDRQGFVERWILAEYLLRAAGPGPKETKPDQDFGKARQSPGRGEFVALGCVGCHPVPDLDPREQPALDRVPLEGLKERMTVTSLAAFLANPQARYPDGRMPRLPVPPETARSLATYLLASSAAAAPDKPPADTVTPKEVEQVARRFRVSGLERTAVALLREKRCGQCHPGLGETTPADVPIRVLDQARGCLAGGIQPHFVLPAETRQAIIAFATVAAQEKHPAPFASRQQLLRRARCHQCHQRDEDRLAPLAEVGSVLAGGGGNDHRRSFQRVPNLSHALGKYTWPYLVSAVRDGVTGVRPDWYSYRMPAFGPDAEALAQALAEADGDLVAGPEPLRLQPADLSLHTQGPGLVGFEGYSCVSCHIWKGESLTVIDPGTIGPELTTVTRRIRRDWFDRFLEGPGRVHPGTPMPQVFFKGKPALLGSILDGDAERQKEALWAYFALGSEAPRPKSLPPVPVTVPLADGAPLVALVPLRLPDGALVESLFVSYANHDLVLYDVSRATLHNFYTGAQVLRSVQRIPRVWTLTGTPIGPGLDAGPAVRLVGPNGREDPAAVRFLGYERVTDGVRIRSQVQFSSGPVEVTETLRVVSEGRGRRLSRDVRLAGVPARSALELRSRVPQGHAVDVVATAGEATGAMADGLFSVRFVPAADAPTVAGTLRYELPPSRAPPSGERPTLAVDPGTSEGSLERPGYRAIAYPRPKTAAGDDLVMPGALAVHPRDGRLFIASMRQGEIFVLQDPHDNGQGARFENYSSCLVHEAYGMLCEDDALYVLHRRNLTRVRDADGDGKAETFDRVAALSHGVGGTYDYGYGLVRDRTGAFVFTYAPWANRHLSGSGGALRLMPGKDEAPEEVAYGFRNPLGWCTGPEGEVFFSDNQGEWVATNKLCHLVPGRFYGFPNPAQPQHANKPHGKAAVWVPYGWAKSINGVAYDASGGKFGPFAGQLFLAELMYGGAILRANVERVNGEYQGACFPFWGKGLLGPLTLAFDPRGRLFVGSITEPGWMRQPERGLLFRIDFTGRTPFEIQSLHVLPQGFRLIFTAPVDPEAASALAAYAIESYRYGYWADYGSPELDRTRLAIERVRLHGDGRTVDLLTAPLVKERVYLISARGVKSAQGESLVHPEGAYTLNEIPAPQ
jgi:mono/diheme cytochrome c family protein/glucose/arabinose dehydrogenase